jgi:tetratricopeptide (TPR) repeat protein
MKKFLVLIVAICISIGAVAQMGKVTSATGFMDQGALDKAKEALDQALGNEKSMNNPKTWVAKGRLCQEIFKSDNPKFKELIPNPLDEALASYQKALELDPKGSVKKQFTLNQTYVLLGQDFVAEGVKKFETPAGAPDFEGALKSFENTIKVATSDIYVGALDSGIYFNAGLAAYNGKLYARAIPYFKKCTEIKYEKTMPYFLAYQSYMALKDTANGEAILKEAFKVYPDNQDVVLQLVDHYMKCNRLAEAFSYINLAKSKDPNNHSLHWAEGVLYMKQEKYNEAIACLTKSVEIKGDLFDTQFNLGVCYYNKAVEMVQKANDIMDATKYNAAVGEANVVFINALPYFEKANSLKPNDVDTLKNLKELYFRLRVVKPEYQAKYDEMVKKLGGK